MIQATREEGEYVASLREQAVAKLSDDERTYLNSLRPKPTAGQYAAQTGLSLARGLSTVVEDVARLPQRMGRLAAETVLPEGGALNLARIATRAADGANLSESIPDVPEVVASEPGLARFATTTGASAVGSMIPSLATAGVGAAAGLGARGVAALGAGAGAAMNAGAGVREAQEAGATQVEQWGAFAVNAGLGVGEGVAPTRIIQTLAKLDSASGGMLKRAVVTAAMEGSTEAIQQVGSDLYAKGTFAPERDLEGWKDAAAGGGFAAGVLEALAGAVAGVKRRGKGSFAEQTAAKAQPVSLAQEQPGLDLTGASGPVAEQGAKPANLTQTTPPPSPTAAPGREGEQSVGGPEPDIGDLAGPVRIPAVRPEPEPEAASLAGRVELPPDQPEPEPDAATLAGPVRTPPVPEKKPAPPSERLGINTGVKNRTVDAELEAMGLPPAEHGESMSDQDRYVRAKDEFDADNLVGKRLADEIDATGRAPTPDEVATLTFEANRLINERDAAEKAHIEGANPATEQRRQAALTEYARFADIVTKMGTTQAQAFRLRRMMLARDYSLAAMEQRLVADQAGLPLTEEQQAGVKKDHDEIQAMMAREQEQAATRNREARIAALEAAVAELTKAGPLVQPKRASARAVRIKQIDVELDAVIRRLASKAARAGAPLDLVADTGLAAKLLIEKGVLKFADFAEYMVKNVGEHVRPHLEQAWKVAATERRANLAGPLAERVKGGEKLTSLRRYVEQIALDFVESGVTEQDKLVDAVHGVLVTIDPKITRDQTMDAISGYGAFSPLSQDEARRALRDLKGQMQQLGKLRDLAAKLPPKKTGVERRTPTNAERRLIKRVNEEMRKLGIRVTNPETQLKSALDSLKTQLRNQIADLQTQIDTKKKLVDQRTPVERDAEAEVLEAERDALKEQFAEVFPEPAKPDPQLKALEKQIADIDAKLKGTFKPTAPKQGPDTAEIAALKEKRDAMNEQLAEMRKKPKMDPIIAATRSLEKQIADYELRIATGDTAVRAGKPADPRLASLRAQRDALAEELADLRSANDPETTPEQKAIKSRMARDKRKLADLEDRMQRGDFSKKQRREPPPITEDELETKTKLRIAERRYSQRREAARLDARTRGEKVLDAGAEILNLPKAVWSGYDLSAVFRQGGFFALGHPIKTIRHIKGMLGAVVSEKRMVEIDTALRNRPMAALAERAGLELTALDGSLTKQEEAIRSHWSDKFPFMKASNRAYITFLNMQRASMFDKYVQGHPDGIAPLYDAKEIARHINIGTGRGTSRPDKLLTTLLWSPKLVQSRFQLIMPLRQATHGSAFTRKQVAKTYARHLIALSVIYSLARLLGFDIEEDPRSSDFGKIRIGNTRIDPLSGIAQVTVLVSKLATGETKTLDGKIKPIRGDEVPYGSPDSWDVFTRFLRTKLSPTISVPMDAVIGENVVGEKVDATYLAKQAIPLSMRDIYESMVEHGVAPGAALAILSLFGMGVQTYGDKKK